jgi:hypothetical protein
MSNSLGVPIQGAFILANFVCVLAEIVFLLMNFDFIVIRRDFILMQMTFIVAGTSFVRMKIVFIRPNFESSLKILEFVLMKIDLPATKSEIGMMSASKLRMQQTKFITIAFHGAADDWWSSTRIPARQGHAAGVFKQKWARRRFDVAIRWLCPRI